MLHLEYQVACIHATLVRDGWTTQSWSAVGPLWSRHEQFNVYFRDLNSVDLLLFIVRILSVNCSFSSGVIAKMAQAALNPDGALVAVIADEDTITGFLLAGVGNVDLRKKTNYLVVDSKTPVKTIESAFKEFTVREDIAIVLISQNVAGLIRHVIDQHQKAVPAVLEIPSKDCPYDPSADSLLCRVKHIFGSS